MKNIFIAEYHESRYLELVKAAEIHEHDRERQSLFYIVSGNEDLYLKRNRIYDFYENMIETDCIISENDDFCSSSKALIRLAYNLYNGYWDEYTNPLSLLCGLDSKNLFLAYQAILMRLQDRINYLALACNGG